MKDLTILNSLIIGRIEPHIYAFTTNTVPNYLKVGDTHRPVSKRLGEWREVYPNLEQKFEGSARITDDVYFRDFAVHCFLESEKHRIRLTEADLPMGVYYSKEFFKDATVNDVEEAIADIHDDYKTKSGKYNYYDVKTQLPTKEKFPSTGEWLLRPNQQATVDAFKRAVANGRTHLLMYAVMRFGKSFTSMCCAKEMGAKLVVVVSAKVDVGEEWRRTVQSADNFRNEYEFFSSKDLNNNYSIIPHILDDPTNPKKAVVFVTLQDLQGEDIKDKHAQIFDRKIDLLLVDETHVGARAEKYGAVLRASQGEKLSEEEKCTVEDILENTKRFDVNVTVHLSGTPYRILMSNEFDREQDLIAFYQFTDIVREQEEWDKENFAKNEHEQKEEWENPYFGFPQMIRFAFNPNESVRKRMAALRESGMSDAFSELFKPKSVKKAKDGSHKLFVHEQEILELLEVIDGSKEDEELLGFLDYDKIKDGKMCRHIVAVLPYCASCDALEALIKGNADKFKNLNDYEIINISGVDSHNIYKEPSDIKKAIRRCEEQDKKTITLTVNRMLTGSTVPEWDTMLFLKDTSSPQEYDQAIFRLQNQYIKTLVGDNGEIIKFNMKPQTLLVDFDLDRVFAMQEQKAQVYNVNTDEAGNSKLRERIEEELRISPIIVMNKDKIVQITATDILKAVSEYSKSRGVAEETGEIPVDMSLLDYDAIRAAIERENELGSKAGFTVKGANGEGDDMNMPEDKPDDTAGRTSTATGTDTPADKPADKTQEEEKDPEKQFRSYYARILFFAFLTKNTVISLSEIIEYIDEPNNARIAKNLGISKVVLENILAHAVPFVLRSLDYKIHNLNQLSHDESVEPIIRASVSVQKFGKLGESEVITPKHICKDMINMIDDADWRAVIDSGDKVLDIAGKAGEFALAVFEKYISLGYDKEALKDVIYTIPTSGITYEFTRMIYEILGLNVDNIASRFTSFSLLEVKDEKAKKAKIDCEKIARLLRQNKPFNSITTNDEIAEGDETVNFGVVVGNPPYQEIVSKAKGNRSLGKQLFPSFIKAAITLSKKNVSLITPSKWFTSEGQDGSFVPLRDYAKKNNHFKIIYNFADNSPVFGGVAIGAVNYFLFDKTYTGNVLFKSCNSEAERPLFEDGMDIILSMEQMVGIVNKVRYHKDFESLMSLTRGRDAFGIPGKKEYLENNTSEAPFNNCASVRCAYEKIRYIDKNKINKNLSIVEHWKVFTSKGNGAAGTLDSSTPNSIIGKAYVGEPNSACSDSLIPIGSFETEAEAVNLSKYMATKFLRFMVGVMKSSRNIYQVVYRFVPLQDFTEASDIDWSKNTAEIDTQLYAKYALTEEEIEFIESMIKPME